MTAIGGLKAAAKRTAFGDVSNTVKDLAAPRDVSNALGKKPVEQAIVKPAGAQENVAAFLRPAQRPLNAGSKIQLAPAAREPIAKPVQQTQQAQQVQAVQVNRVTTKSTTVIFKDPAESEQLPKPAVQTIIQVPTGPAHMSLAPRHYKSQPYLKPAPSTLQLAQSKPVAVEHVAPIVNSDPIYEDAPEQPLAQSPKDNYQSYMKLIEDKDNEIVHEVKEAREIGEAQVAQESVMPVASAAEAHHRLPSLPEPEEYWEEEDEEIYDEQGYTTAHSYRSRGDNTTGGATTVLLPKITHKVRKEIAEAKELVERMRTPEEIDDEAWDTSMVAEYGEEIFSYMRELEVSIPSPLSSTGLFTGRLAYLLKLHNWPRTGPCLRPPLPLFTLHDATC